jgi:hypothetical protein
MASDLASVSILLGWLVGRFTQASIADWISNVSPANDRMQGNDVGI